MAANSYRAQDTLYPAGHARKRLMHQRVAPLTREPTMVGQQTIQLRHTPSEGFAKQLQPWSRVSARQSAADKTNVCQACASHKVCCCAHNI